MFMIKRIFKTAFRHLWTHKAFSVINAFGLSVGISAALVIFLMVHYEFRFDRFGERGKDVYRVVMDFKFSGMEGHSAAVPAPLASAIAQEMPGVILTVPIFHLQGDGTTGVTVPAEDHAQPAVFKKQQDVVFTNPQYFSLWPYAWIAGSRTAALGSPFSVVLTESRAAQYFPQLPPAAVVGKALIYNEGSANALRVRVTGIVRDLAGPSTLSGKEFISLRTLDHSGLRDNFMMDTWDDWMANSTLYLKLAAGTPRAHAEKQLGALFTRYRRNTDSSQQIHLVLQPLKDVHMDSRYQGPGQRTAHKASLYGLLALAGVLLLLGCINFINLQTAQASRRAREIGIKKALGSSRKQLAMDCLGEAFLITLIATLLSLLFTPVLFRAFASFLPPGLDFQPGSESSLWLFLLGLTLLISLGAGLYPAFVLSAYRPVTVLKGQPVAGEGRAGGAWLRKALTLSQFTIAQFFVIATFMVGRQIHFVMSKDLGFRREGILTFSVPSTDSLPQRQMRLLQTVKALPGVQAASMGFVSPAEEGASFTNISYQAGREEIKFPVQIRWGDTGYLGLYHIPLVAGRNVRQSDTIREFIINETYARMLGFPHPEDALGQSLRFNQRDVPIVGVMRDFHEQSLHNTIGPMVFSCFNQRSSMLHVALRPQQQSAVPWSATIAQLADNYKHIYPESDFSFSFYDETIARFYAQEQRMSTLLEWATGLAIFISCLGLLGLATFIAESRTREIGIRKLLGASVSRIVALLSKDFLVIAGLAFLIAVPAGWWATHRWLEGFAYKATLSWWLFALSGLTMMLVTAATLGLQTIKAASANPVKSLRTA